MEETTTVGRCKDTGVTPALTRQVTGCCGIGHRGHIDDIDDQEIPGFGTLHAERPRQRVSDVERRGEDILGGFVIMHRAVEPVATVNAEGLPRPDGLHRGNIRMPPVVAQALLMMEGLG